VTGAIDPNCFTLSSRAVKCTRVVVTSAGNLDVQRSGIVQGATVRVCTDVMTIEGSGMLSAAGERASGAP